MNVALLVSQPDDADSRLEEKWDEFLAATSAIKEEIGISEAKVEMAKHETPGVGYLYQGTISQNGYHVHFTVDARGSSNKIYDWKELALSINIGFPDGTRDDAHQTFSKTSEAPYFADWVIKAFHEFNIKARKVNLDSLFEGSEVRILGFPGMDHYTLITSLLSGAAQEDIFPPTVMRFRHVTGRGAAIGVRFSYVVRVASTWVAFPDIAGLSGGSSYDAYVEIEKAISKLSAKNTEVTHFDCSEREFMKYFARHANFLGNSWDLIDKREELIDFYLSVIVAPAPGEPVSRFKAEIEKIDNNIWNDQYPEALRNQRALLQDALQDLMRSRNLHFEDGSRIAQLAGILIEHHAIEPRLKSWFDAYPTFANPSAHGIHPTKKELEDEVIRNRVRVTLSLGKHLLYEVLGALFASEGSHSGNVGSAGLPGDEDDE